MPFHFTCPYCFRKTLVDDDLAGKSGPCAGCGKDVTIPNAPARHPDAAAPVDSEYVDVGSQKANRRAMLWLLEGAVLFGLIAVVSLACIYFFWPTFEGLRARRNKTACMNNLRRIALALESYADTHGSYPPAVVYDANGKAMHSWRILILPELGEESLYAQYDFTKPWDATENTRLLDRCPEVYVSPAADPSSNESSYFLITGKGTVFPPAGPMKPWEISDGKSKTLLVVESENTTYEWTNPIDIDAGRVNRKIGARGKNTIGGNHSDGATGVFADGTPAWLPEDLDPQLLDSIITPDGGEPVDPEDFRLR